MAGFAYVPTAEPLRLWVVSDYGVLTSHAVAFWEVQKAVPGGKWDGEQASQTYPLVLGLDGDSEVVRVDPTTTLYESAGIFPLGESPTRERVLATMAWLCHRQVEDEYREALTHRLEALKAASDDTWLSLAMKVSE